MKRALLTIIFIAGSFFIASAQTEKEDIAIAQSIFGKTKKAVISDNIQISETEQKAFWALYDQYETKSNEINMARLDLIKRYADNYNTLTDESAAKLATDYIDNSAKYFALYKDFFPKFKKVMGGVKAATLIQLEIYMQTAIQANLQSQIPVIGQLQKQQH